MKWRKIKSFIRAVVSFARYGDLVLSQYQKRMAACYECPELKTTLTGQFCGACDCPRWPVSDLRTKWRTPDAACPLQKW